MAAPAKILVCGDVCGKIRLFAKKIKTLNSKYGPFECCLVAGQFFGRGDAWRAQLEPFLCHEQTLALPCYILAGDDDGHSVVPEPMRASGGELCTNLVYLGRAGVLGMACGLQVAYLSGTYDASAFTASSDPTVYPSHYTSRDLDALMGATHGAGFTGVDALLTLEWPAAVMAHVPPADHPVDPRAIQPPPAWADAATMRFSPATALATSALAPQYHFAGGHSHTYFQRPPYTNHKAPHVTRFVGMAALGNKAKAKSVYAVNITPGSRPVARPPATTPCPLPNHADVAATAAAAGDNVSFFYRPNKRQRGTGGVPIATSMHLWGSAGQRPGAPVTGKRKRDDLPRSRGAPLPPQGRAPPRPCWFCLSSPDVEKHLVVSVGEHAYVALAKGGLTPDHVLVLPIEHHPCARVLPAQVRAEMDTYVLSLQRMFQSQERSTLVWERFIRTGTAHAHIQVCPVPKRDDSGEQQRSVLRECAEPIGLDFQPYAPDTHSGDSPYFYVELCDSHKLNADLSQVRIPMQFGRRVAAALLGAPERENWKSCQVSREEEQAYAHAFAKAFAPWDVVGGGSDSDSDSASDSDSDADASGGADDEGSKAGEQ